MASFGRGDGVPGAPSPRPVRGDEQELAELPGAEQRPAHAPGPVVHRRVDVGEDEVLPVPAAPDHHLPERVDGVAVPVPDPVAQPRGLVEHAVHPRSRYFPPPIWVRMKANALAWASAT